MKKTMNNELKANFDNPKKEKSIFDESFFDDDEKQSEDEDEEEDDEEELEEELEEEDSEDLDENFDEELEDDEEYEEVESEMDEAPNPGMPLNTTLPNRQMSNAVNTSADESIHDQRTSDKKRNLPKEIQFRLVCEVGQILIPFENLQELSIGSVVNFNNTLQNLYLSVNNVRVGEGMLVDIDGKIGIKVTHWYGRV